MAQLDYSPGMHPGPNGPGVRAAPIVPSDGALLPYVARKVWVGTTGNINALVRDDLTPTLFQNVPGGAFWQMTVRQVLATGTTATNLVAVA